MQQSCTSDLSVEPIDQDLYYVNGVISNNDNSIVDVGLIDNSNLTDFQRFCNTDNLVEVIEIKDNLKSKLQLNELCRYEGGPFAESKSYNLHLDVNGFKISADNILLPKIQAPLNIEPKARLEFINSRKKGYTLEFKILFPEDLSVKTFAAVSVAILDSIILLEQPFINGSSKLIDFPFKSTLIETDLSNLTLVNCSTSINVETEVKSVKVKLIIYFANEKSFLYAKKLNEQVLSLIDPFAVPVVVEGNVKGAYGFVYGISAYEQIFEISIPE